VLVQANFGRRHQLTIGGVPVGRFITAQQVPTFYEQEQGSIIVVLATDAPLVPHQLNTLARRASHGIARTGGVSGISSGDMAVAFSTANAGLFERLGREKEADLRCCSDTVLDVLFAAVAYATEEAIVNAIVAAEDMTGYKGNSVQKLPLDMLKQAFAAFSPPRLV
jgi:D-aminopeptidase